uniref:CDT1 domain-containing protein n=1 Tax=Caenorhabditis tropicalis TaxID=1561998 RepID=A0A1I7TN52_9PELO
MCSSSESIVFNAPYPTVIYPLVTAKEVKDLKRKIRGLNKLLNKPRTSLPELQPFLFQLMEAMNVLIISSRYQYTTEARSIIEMGFRTTKMLEDIVIRVVLRGDSPRVVYDAHLAELQKSIVVSRESSQGTSSLI